MRPEHPLVVALVEAFARKAGIDTEALWRALDGLPSPRFLVDGLVAAFEPAVTEKDFVVDGDEGLTARTEPSTIRTMRTTEIDIDEPRAGRPLRRGGRNKAGERLVEVLRERKISLTEVAKRLKRSDGALRRYLLPVDSDHYLPIPEQVAGYIEAEYKVRKRDWPKRVS